MTPFLFIQVFDENKFVVKQKISVSLGDLFADFLAKNMFFQCFLNTVTTFSSFFNEFTL